MYEDIWHQLRQKLPFQLNIEQTNKRNKFWQDFDIKENGYITFEQVLKGCADILHLPGMFQINPILRKAYNKAKNAIISFQKHSDDFVSKAEFRFLLKYLRQYYEYQVAFNRIDTDHNKQIDLNQFKMARPVMARWGIKIKSDLQAKNIFFSIDINCGGTIIFNQFVQWAIKMNLDLDDDDDYA